MVHSLPIPPVEKDLYVIETYLYVRIRRLRLILYHWFFSIAWVVFIGGMGRYGYYQKYTK
jgi:hypothetical protein